MLLIYRMFTRKNIKKKTKHFFKYIFKKAIYDVHACICVVYLPNIVNFLLYYWLICTYLVPHIVSVGIQHVKHDMITLRRYLCTTFSILHCT